MATPQRAGPAQPARAPASPSGRMALARVVRGVQSKPLRLLLYGVEGVGKTTFAAGAPEPIFVCPEDGTGHLDVARFPEPQSWADVLECVDVLSRESHNYRTLVIDTVDWLEPLVWRFICERDNQADIESYGYGKGYVAALTEWRVLVARLEQLRAQRGLGVVLLAHSWIKPYKNPEGSDFDRYETKLHPRAGGLLREWCDVVLFANYETVVYEDKRKRVRGVSTGVRLAYTERTAAYDAKNRLNLPPTLPLDWDAFVEAISVNRPADPATIKARIAELLISVDAELRAKVEAAVAQQPDDGAYLARVLNKLAGMVSAKENAA